MGNSVVTVLVADHFRRRTGESEFDVAIRGVRGIAVVIEEAVREVRAPAVNDGCVKVIYGIPDPVKILKCV